MLPVKLLLLVGAAQAFPWDGARPTFGFNLPLRYSEPPEPTGAARLVERQAPGDVTCGWENGKGTSSFELYCASQAVCATNTLGAFGCCQSTELDDCALATACIDSTAINQQYSSYGEDDFAVSCTASQAPNCITQLLELNPAFSGFYCGSTGYARTETYYSTYSNASATQSIVSPTFYNAAYDSYTTPVLVTSTSSSTRTTTTSTTASTTSATSSSVVTSTSSPTPTPVPDNSGSSTPVGAIVGGTVGGVAVIAGVALLAFFLIQRSKRQKNNAPPETGPQPPMQQPQNPPATQSPPAQYPLPVHYPPAAEYNPAPQYPQPPAQPEYGYAGQAPPQQPYPAYFPEKGAAQSTLPVHGSPETNFSSPSSPAPDRTSNVPPPSDYSPRHELVG